MYLLIIEYVPAKGRIKITKQPAKAFTKKYFRLNPCQTLQKHSFYKVYKTLIWKLICCFQYLAADI
jgi:hypothetical protein